MLRHARRLKNAGQIPVLPFSKQPVLSELVATWPARQRPNDTEKGRGWGMPSLDELRIARSQAHSLERKNKEEYAD